jgi:DNA repair protein RadC
MNVMETLFDSACRYMSDSELIYEITNNKKIVTETEQQSGEYDLNGLFSSLTPGRKKVATAAIELYKRLQSRYNGQDAIRCSQDINALMYPFLWDLPNEELWVLALNNASRVIKKVRVSVGGITQTAADVRLIMRILVEVSATQFVVVHNHPSGNKQPSRDDKHITERLKKAGEVFDIRLIDHVIIAGDTYYSFSDEGIL